MTIFFERLLLYRKILNNIGGNKDIYALLSSGNYNDAKILISEKTSSYTLDKRVLNDALNLDIPDRETVEMVLTHGVGREVKFLSRTLNTLAVLASVSPLLGLLGTVIGMIKAFMVVEEMGDNKVFIFND